ncbi:MAG: hypothetical protein ACI4C4_14035, partial [Lachnospiraceae bacterium]
SEVLGMLLEEFDVEKYERTIKKEGYEAGHASGVQEGKQKAGEQINKLTVVLLEQNRTGDLLRAAKDKEYQKQLLEEYNL